MAQLWRVPDRRGVGAFLTDKFRLLGNLGTKANLVVEHPAWSGNLKHPGVVESRFFRIEIRIRPDGSKLGSTDRIGPVGGFFIDRISDRSLADSVFDFTVAGYGNIVDFLMQFAVRIEPTLDHLDSIQIGSDRVTDRVNHEVRSFFSSSFPQITAHRDTLLVADKTGVAAVRIALLEAPTTEELGDDFRGDDQWVDGEIRAVLIEGDHITVWQDEPLTEEDKREIVAYYVDHKKESQTFERRAYEEQGN
jgi:hypothetical protein